MRVIICLTALLVVLFIYFSSLQLGISKLVRPGKEEPPENTFLYVYRTYLDRRGKFPKLRVLAFNKCLQESALSAKIGHDWQALRPTPMFKSCPESWSPGCSLVGYFHETYVDEKFAPNEILVQGPSATELFPLHVVEPAKERGITVCIAPMFWYNDWARLIFFTEYWKKQQTKNILVYVHSTTAEVKKVLDFYENQGIITVIPWPMLPSTGSFQPNDEIFRLGQMFAHNDCFLRTTTEFTAVVDIDEVLYTPNQLLTDYVYKNFEKSYIGSLTFHHYAAALKEPLFPKPYAFEGVSFNGVHSLYYNYDWSRQPKIIARTNSVDRMGVHYVIAFRNQELDLKAKDAMYFHIRFDVDHTGPDWQNTTIIEDTQWFQTHLLNTTQTIFPNGASFHEETQTFMETCTDSWRETQDNCMTPVTFCRSWIIDKEEWVEETENAYTVL